MKFFDRIKLTGAASTTVLALVSGSAMAQQKNVRFVLDWVFQGQQSVFTLPADDRTYAKYNLNVTVDRGAGSGDAVTKVASGTYDIGLADVYTMMNHNANNPDRKLIAVALVHDKSALSIASLKTAKINSPADLNGKRLAAPLGDASRQVFPLFASINKLNQGSMEWITVTPQLRETMLVRGQADAISGHITTITMNLRSMGVAMDNVNLMLYADHGVELYGHALITTPAFAQANPQVITDFIRSTVHGLNVMIRDRDAAMASIKKRDPLVNDEIEKARIQLSLDAMFLSRNVLENGMSNVDMTRLSRTLDQAAEAFQVKTKQSAADTYTDRYLPPRSELRVIGK
jgi:NitT/TauT family transport system substrate-binding protein